MIKSSLSTVGTSENQYWKSTYAMPHEKYILNDTMTCICLVTFRKVFPKFSIVVFNNVLHVIAFHTTVLKATASHGTVAFSWETVWRLLELIAKTCHFFWAVLGTGNKVLLWITHIRVCRRWTRRSGMSYIY